ncbi:MAG: hypothetical protein GY772_16070, partial [bacterium]|nr:hypothetical protein [bacterium]
MQLTIDDRRHYENPGVGRAEAHKWLAALRRHCAEQRQPFVDLTDDPAYAWRGYICGHRLARDIIGTGVTGFQARFLNALEPNRQSLALPAPYGQHRFDFVVLRRDGSAVRLHPGGSAETKPIVGRLDEWLLENRASTP